MLLSVFQQFAAFLATWMSKKVAFAAAAVTTLGLLTAALFIALGVLLNSVALALPPLSNLSQAILYVVLPSNLPLCIGACISADTALALYRWNVENLRLAAYVT
jgi:hypothetical protein